jgi:hypothetical protein
MSDFVSSSITDLFKPNMVGISQVSRDPTFSAISSTRAENLEPSDMPLTVESSNLVPKPQNSRLMRTFGEGIRAISPGNFSNNFHSISELLSTLSNDTNLTPEQLSAATVLNKQFNDCDENLNLLQAGMNTLLQG